MHGFSVDGTEAGGNTTTEQQVFVVTGGSNGIGLATVQALLREIPNCLVFNLDKEAPQQTESAGCWKDRLFYRPIDVSNGRLFSNQLQQIHQEHHRLDGLVNNAGIFETRENSNVLWDDSTTEEQIDDLLQTNLGSVVHGTRTVARLMKKSSTGASIVNIASTAALGVFSNHPVYCSTKAAVLQFSQTAKADLDDETGIRVHCICPGIVDTNMGRMGGDANRQAVAKLKGGKRNSPHLVASVVVGLLQRTNTDWMEASYLIVDNHQVTAVP